MGRYMYEESSWQVNQYLHGSSPLSIGCEFQYHQCMPESMSSVECHICCFSVYTCLQ